MKKKISKEDQKEEAKKKVVVVEEIPENQASDDVQPTDSVNEETETKTENKEETKNEETTTNVSSSIEEPLEEKSNYLWIIIPTALLVGALAGGFITYFSGISKLSDNPSSPTPTATEIAEVKPTATPAIASVDRSEIKLQVLNGSGISGLAGKAKVYLESLGYKDVAVGNASSSDFSETEIQLKDTQKDFLKTITADLSKNYKVSEETKTLSASSKYDIVITLGNK